MTTAMIELRGVSKRFESHVAVVNHASFSVGQGQIMALLGASGCGKTTTLRLIAGLERPDEGEIWLNGRCIANATQWMPPERRNIGMMFQDYALFPHMNVYANINFALKNWRRVERRARVAELLSLVDLTDYARRFPHQISGGQQQRAALARALAPRPDVVLLDEPFSNLDAALRKTTREEVRDILKNAGATTIFVTHDQEEAMSIADVVAVMKAGNILQIGTPREIYLYPARRDVAEFIGQTNFLSATARGECADCILGNLLLQKSAQGKVDVLIRPELITLHPDPGGLGRILSIQFVGYDMLVKVGVGDSLMLEVRTRAHNEFSVGMAVNLTVKDALLAYPSGNGAL